MADESIRQQLMEAVDTRMKTILKSNGYASDLGANAEPWRLTDYEDDHPEAITYRDTDNAKTWDTATGWTCHLTVEMEIHPASGAATITDAYTLLGDVMRAIATDDRWGGLADDTEPGADSIEIEQHDRIVGRITFTIRIEYSAEKWGF